jgi:hypothetical protein
MLASLLMSILQVYSPLELLLFIAGCCTIADSFVPQLINVPKATVTHVVRSVLSVSFVVGASVVVYNLKSRFCKEQAWQVSTSVSCTHIGFLQAHWFSASFSCRLLASRFLQAAFCRLTAQLLGIAAELPGVRLGEASGLLIMHLASLLVAFWQQKLAAINRPSCGSQVVVS